MDHQEIMNKAYARLRTNQSWTRLQFFDQLDPEERFAVCTGNLNYQVQNGGFSQWYYNGYAEDHLDYLIRALSRLTTPTAGEVVKLLRKFRRLDLAQFEGDLSHRACLDLDELDDRYYEIMDVFMLECQQALDLKSYI